MKKLCIAALALVLTLGLMTGCRDRNQPMETTMPTVMPTTAPTTVPTTEATRPTVQETMPRETIDNGNGPVDGTDGMDGTDSTVEGRTVNPRTGNKI